jgi:Protein of unknown function (DUF3050)
MVVSQRRDSESRLVAVLQSDVDVARQQAINHPLYASLTSVARVQAFMSVHVFAVWDFMSLLKALQQRLTCVDVPWSPRGDTLCRRLINEIVLGEESDHFEGNILSHFEMYLAAMDQAGADRAPLERFLDTIAATRDVPRALDMAGVPEAADQFVRATWRVIDRGEAFELAAVFAFGRESLIPAMFTHVLEGEHCMPLLRDYLIRHVQIDEEVHTPLAMRMVATLCGDDPARWAVARRAVLDALAARTRMWDGIISHLPDDGLAVA